MQITIDTNSILGDETTIRDEVISEVSKALILSMRTQAKVELQKFVDDSIRAEVDAAMKDIVGLALDTPFAPVDEYGRVGKMGSIRDMIASRIQEACKYQPKNHSSYENDFTKAVRTTVEQEVQKFKKEFDSLVTKAVVEQSADHALQKLKASLGIK